MHAPLRAQGRFPRLCITEFGSDEGLKCPGRQIFAVHARASVRALKRLQICRAQASVRASAAFRPAQGFPSGSVTRSIASACLGPSQRISRVSDIASTIVDDTPILVM